MDSNERSLHEPVYLGEIGGRSVYRFRVGLESENGRILDDQIIVSHSAREACVAVYEEAPADVFVVHTDTPDGRQFCWGRDHDGEVE